MHEDDEMKAQCFGGDYMGEVYDNNLKRMQLRRQKRWWNAYMLFYTRCDEVKVPVIPSIEQLSLAESRNCVLPMPAPIEKSVRSQNLRFLHSRNLFSAEFFNFIRKLVSCCLPSNLTGVEKWVRLMMQAQNSKNKISIKNFSLHKLKNCHCSEYNWDASFCSILVFTRRKRCVVQLLIGMKL